MEAFISGTVSSSILKWPNKKSFLVLFAGCNFRCPYCFSSEFLDKKERFKIDLNEIKEEIKENKNFVDAIIFTGGEPCLQKRALLNLAEFCKELGLKTGIETNGSNPEVIKGLIEKELIDFVGLDLKSPLEKEKFEKVTKAGTFFQSSEEIVENIKKSLEILENNKEKIETEIRTVVVPRLIYRKEDLSKIAKIISKKKIKWRIRSFKCKKNKVLSKNLRKVKSPTEEFLKEIKQFCKKKFPDLKIKIYE